MLSIDAATLKKMIDSNEDVLLLDVRELTERELFHIGGEHVPLSSVVEYGNKIPVGKKVILYCEKGIRSVIAIQRLQQKFPLLELYNLSGGMQAWKMSQ
jgi:rhodanese-related sulfurtransferase